MSGKTDRKQKMSEGFFFFKAACKLFACNYLCIQMQKHAFQIHFQSETRHGNAKTNKERLLNLEMLTLSF